MYDGDALVAEYDASGNMLRRYVHGQGADTPQVWFEGAGTSASVRRYLFTNHQGSVTAIADGNGNTMAINRYDEYGIPGSGNIGRFQYTGQAWLEDLGMYHYKARIYSPTLGRFLQTDPIGYEDQINLYAYVGNDPVNMVDPTGMCGADDPEYPMPCPEEIVVEGEKPEEPSRGSVEPDRQQPKVKPEPQNDVIVVTAPRKIPHRRRPDPNWPKDMQPNGCTGVPNIFPQLCYVHDVCYTTLGAAKDYCDREFYRNMVAERPSRRGLALDYYIGVMQIGGMFYRSAQDAARQYRDQGKR